MVLVLSIDIGINNLGYVYAELSIPTDFSGSRYKNLINNSNYSINETIKIIECNRIDITKMKHHIVSMCNCKLLHERCVPDYLDHFIQEHQEMFDNADIVILERQPPVGITNVQDLLFKTFRSKIKMISPNTINKYFKMSSDYDTRKIESEKIANDYLYENKDYLNNIRKHDISDALLMILYYYKIELDTLIKKYSFNKTFLPFEEYIYKK